MRNKNYNGELLSNLNYLKDYFKEKGEFPEKKGDLDLPYPSRIKKKEIEYVGQCLASGTDDLELISFFMPIYEYVKGNQSIGIDEKIMKEEFCELIASVKDEYKKEILMKINYTQDDEVISPLIHVDTCDTDDLQNMDIYDQMPIDLLDLEVELYYLDIANIKERKDEIIKSNKQRVISRVLRTYNEIKDTCEDMSIITNSCKTLENLEIYIDFLIKCDTKNPKIEEFLLTWYLDEDLMNKMLKMPKDELDGLLNAMSELDNLQDDEFDIISEKKEEAVKYIQQKRQIEEEMFDKDFLEMLFEEKEENLPY